MAGIKLHETKNCLLRNNLVRHLRFAPGIWLDSGNFNTRVTRNVVLDIAETVEGGIFLEASHEIDMIDDNIIWKATMGLINSSEGVQRRGGYGVITTHSDETVIAHNLIGECEGPGVGMQTQETRLSGNRGGTARWNRVLNNIFVNSGKSIEFPHKENMAEGNVYSRSTRGGRGLNWISSPAPAVRVDLPAWQRYFGFDKTGTYADVDFELDADRLQMTWKSTAELPDMETGGCFREDFSGAAVGARRKPGPFAGSPVAGQQVAIDPRGHQFHERHIQKAISRVSGLHAGARWNGRPDRSAALAARGAVARGCTRGLSRVGVAPALPSAGRIVATRPRHGTEQSEHQGVHLGAGA